MRMLRVLLPWILLLLPVLANARIEVLAPKLESAKYRELAQELHKAGVLQEFAKGINESMRLPQKVGLRFVECGEANAFYDSSTREISMCLELLDTYYETLAEQYESEEELDEAAWNAYIVVLFHEFGHALIDVLDLPITGREEDAVDQLAAWSLIDNAEGDAAVLDAALSYYVSAEASDKEFYESDFADEHSLDSQRYYNLVCWVYGSDPDKHAHLVDEEWLPAERAERCPDEYQQIDRSWSRLLEGSAKQDQG
ncbi:MAG: DUF4344 domain-containing metallopeptidase [Xanthomonadales bacterium]|nr:hypothetical protein [Xanthomonadales bacterium]MCC6592804.1 DUF4344 domain-containing metallopeptidase [Xanthomonadales bacterium]MCE7931693.1 hypothetical protein [Xanthomonadales bacterium PRO6]